MNESFGVPSDNDQGPTLLSKAIEQFKSTEYQSIPKMREVKKADTQQRRPIKKLANNDNHEQSAQKNLPPMMQMDPSILIGAKPKIIKRKGYDYMVSTEHTAAKYERETPMFLAPVDSSQL